MKMGFFFLIVGASHQNPDVDCVKSFFSDLSDQSCATYHFYVHDVLELHIFFVAT